MPRSQTGKRMIFSRKERLAAEDKCERFNLIAVP